MVSVHDFLDGFGAGMATKPERSQARQPGVLFPEIRFYTNDTWPMIRGVAGANGDPILLMNRYSRGVIYVLTIPENQGICTSCRRR